MIINSPLCITHYAGQNPLHLTTQPTDLTDDQLVNFNKLIQSVGTIYASQNSSNSIIPTFWTKVSGIQNGIKVYQPDTNSTLVSLQPKQSYYFIMRESASLPINIPAAGGPIEGFIDSIVNLPSIKIITSPTQLSNLNTMSAPIASITSPTYINNTNTNNNSNQVDTNTLVETQAILPNVFNATNNTYSFNISVTGLQSYKNYTYSVDIIDAEWPTYFVGKPSGTLTTGKNVTDTIEDIYSITNRLVFCVSGVCDSYPDILNPYTSPNYPDLWKSSVDYRVVMRASFRCNDCLNTNIVYSDYIILKYTASNNSSTSLPDISFQIT